MNTNVLVIGEIHKNVVTKSTLEVIEIAGDISEHVSVVFVVSSEPKDGFTGVEHLPVESVSVIFSEENDDDRGIYDFDTEVISMLVESKDYTIVLLSKTDYGSVVGPRVAFRNDMEYLSDCTHISNKNKFEVTRPVYGGVAYADYLVSDESKCIISMRPGSKLLTGSRGEPSIEIKKHKKTSDPKPKMVKEIYEEVDGVKLEDANVVVSGGRGLGSSTGFEDLNHLANILEGALGASRAACDAGWIDHSHQVGLTGKTVSPDLYIAVGISGASQHMAGCSMSRNIVAINNDGDANIFRESRFGVIGNWKPIIQAFISTIEDLHIR